MSETYAASTIESQSKFTIQSCIHKIENGNGEFVKETTIRPNKKTTAEGHQQVFNVARNSRTRKRPSAGP